MSHFKQIAVIGAGLIGGSVLLAASRRKSKCLLTGWSHSKESRLLLQNFGGITVFDEAVDAVKGADLVVIATPVDKIRETLLAISPGLKNGALVTDVGSVKVSVLKDAEVLPKGVVFIGSHPMAGAEKAGFAQAKESLFDGRVCFITPTGKEDSGLLAGLHNFWKSLGAIPAQCDARKHDALVATTSHVPHAAAAALMLAVSQSPEFNTTAAGSGLRDATRIAAGEESLWTGILLENADNVVAGLDLVEKNLKDLRLAIQSGDKEKLRALLKAARLARQAIDRPQ